MPKILLVDVETAPMLGYIWSLWDQTVSLGQLHSDWHLLSWAAKWLDDPADKVMYMDQRKAKKIEDDKKILEGLWKLLDEADIVLTQNGKAFDHKKINARFIIQGIKPPSSYRQIDTKVLAKKHFGFTSNKLEYMTDKLCTKYKKLKHSKFPGFEMWKECLAGNIEAWKEMEKYNKHDVLALEELYYKLRPWDAGLNFSVYSDSTALICSCKSTHFRSKGYHYTNTGKFARWKCVNCGAEVRSRENLFDKAKKASIKAGINRS